MNRVLQLLVLLAWSAAGVDYYVSTNGSGTGTGAIGDPVTFARLSALINSLNQPATAKNVFVRGGNHYAIAQRFVGSRYNNMTVQPYAGETVKLYGGALVTNWTDLGDGTWSAVLPEFPQQATNAANSYWTWEPRMLLADDQIVTWAHTPATGKCYYASYASNKIVYTNDFPEGTNYEANLDLSWYDGLFRVISNNVAEKAFTFGITPSRMSGTENQRTFRIFNDPAGLVENSYYWDKTNLTLYYKPLAGQAPTNKTMVAACATKILSFDSTSSADPISNIVVTNITFACTVGIASLQGDNGGGSSQSSALTFGYATNCVAIGCTFYGIGGHAIGVSPTAADYNWGVRVAGNVIRDAGSSGIMLAGDGQTITNNLIYNFGRYLQGGIGIFASWNSLIAYNTITNGNGAGIAGSQTASGFTVLSNTITRVVKQLRDMGGIYMKGTNNVVLGNYVSEIYGTNDNTTGEALDGVNGIYADAYSWGHVIASNIVINCDRPLHHNSYQPISILNNFFINLRAGNPSSLWGLTSTNNRVFERNIWYADGPLQSRFTKSFVLQPIDTAVSNWAGNLVYSGAGITYPTNATAGDPLFYNTTPVLRDTSPALALGIQPLWGTYGGSPPASIASYTNLTIYGGRVSGVTTH